MQAEIIAIGSELTSGAKLDTNSQWLSRELASLGITVVYHSTVADNIEAMVSLLRDACSRSDVVLITGGLGPTLDDLTRQAIADLLDVELELDESALENIRNLFARHRREMPERNRVQAMFPAGTQAIPNPRGTAPGIWAEIPGENNRLTLLAAMPGVPHEMHHMYHTYVVPRLPRGEMLIREYRINCFGVGESHCEELLGEVTARGREPEVGITVHEGTITLRIHVVAMTENDCETVYQSTRLEIEQRLGTLIFGVEDEELEHVVLAMLRDSGLTLSAAESGTGGLLGQRLSDIDPTGEVYRGGLVLPAESTLTDVLGVDPQTIATHGSHSVEAATDMALRCRDRFQTDLALAITTPRNSRQPQRDDEAETLAIALVGADLLRSTEQALLPDRSFTRSRAAKTALNMIRLELIKAPTH